MRPILILIKIRQSCLEESLFNTCWFQEARILVEPMNDQILSCALLKWPQKAFVCLSSYSWSDSSKFPLYPFSEIKAHFYWNDSLRRKLFPLKCSNTFQTIFAPPSSLQGMRKLTSKCILRSYEAECLCSIFLVGKKLFVISSCQKTVKINRDCWKLWKK